jgi:hypothetical protein
LRKFLGIDIGSDYVSVASKWMQKEKCYVTNIVSTAALRGIWLMRNDFIFNNQVWRDVKQILRKRMAAAVQGGQDGEDDELVVFLGLGDQRTIENCNLMKLGKAQSVAGDTLLILGQVKDEARINEPNAKKLYWCI